MVLVLDVILSQFVVLEVHYHLNYQSDYDSYREHLVLSHVIVKNISSGLEGSQ